MSTWKETSFKGTRTIAAIACLLIPVLSGGPASGQAPAMQGMDIRRAVDMAVGQRQRTFLTDFMNHFEESDSIRVTDYPDHYEIIATRPSFKGMTGGAEQYFLDKETGKGEMGWHEHPMPF